MARLPRLGIVEDKFEQGTVSGGMLMLLEDMLLLSEDMLMPKHMVSFIELRLHKHHKLRIGPKLVDSSRVIGSVGLALGVQCCLTLSLIRTYYY